MSRCICATHGHCFDGLSSAILFSEFLSEVKPGVSFEYIACGYGSTSPPSPRFNGDENALLDYRYIPDPALSFYFDHHPTAFQSEEDRAQFESRRMVSPRQFELDTSFTSCAQLIANHAQEHWNVDLTRHQTLIDWAQKIDGAQFASAEDATNRSEPILRLAAVVDQFGDSTFLEQAIPIARSNGIESLADAHFVKKRYRALAPKYKDYEERMRARGELESGVLVVDLTEAPVNVIAKFAQYRFFPRAKYSIVLARMASGLRVSLGFNPWGGYRCDAHLGNICARHGGGGHSVVGGIAFAPGDADRARTVVRDIARELRSGNSA